MQERCRIQPLSGADRRTTCRKKEYEDNTYYALVPYYGDDEDALAQDDGEFVILKTEEVNGEEMLVSIEEDAEYETIGNKFLERLNEIYGDEDDEEDEDDDEIFE